ncbi:aldo/keto reductase [Salipiger sp. 1_MG-2023]|uniref:aldo/keto reductase n=1 Tax=Salipiger sp. 1_MG-2023 TaxID=3062665 RepID=UPI0026E2EA24|nr:aldo/keto reductase [Salipiger sp. 1_MG-2023]MDO6586599.1 aldo/keto reductase [Salipiger sp. 1_MG-2023]
MKTRTIGTAEVSALGIGAMSFSDFYGETSEAESHALLDRAREVGVSHIDTSNIYGAGRSETVIGSWLAAHPGARDAVHIATKAGIGSDAAGKRVINNSPAYMEAQLDASLKRLGTDHVDLFYAHRYQADLPPEEVAGTLARLVEKGKCRSIGFSEIAPATLRRAASEYPVAAVQSEYSLQTRAPELGLIQTCAELGTALVAFSPVGRSLLTDAPIPRARIETNPFLSVNPRFTLPNHDFNLRALVPFRELAADMGLSTASLAIAWGLHKGEHIVSIPGTRSLAHLDELVAGANAVLTPEDMARIETVLPVGWCHGDRYAPGQWVGPQNYC